MGQIILASASPRRCQLLRQIGLSFEVIPAKCGEETEKDEPDEIVMELSRRKARETASMIKKYEAGHAALVTPQDIMVIGADTVVACPLCDKPAAYAGNCGMDAQGVPRHPNHSGMPDSSGVLGDGRMEAGSVRDLEMPRHLAPSGTRDTSGAFGDGRMEAGSVRDLEMPRHLALSDMRDTSGVLGDGRMDAGRMKILGKPRDEEEAFAMLSMLSGRTHSVYTGVSVVFVDTSGRAGVHTFFERTDVTVRAMDGEEIRRYIATGEPMDKAGAYGIQEKFAIYIDKIDGDYNNVVGLPVAALYRELKGIGIDLYSW